MTRALVTQMLEALNKCRDWPGAHDECAAAIKAAREYLATEPSGERAELIEKLRTLRMYAQSPHGIKKLLTRAADMLEADASLRTQLARRTFERDMVIGMAVGTDAQQAKRVPMTEPEDLYALALKADNLGQP